MHIANRHRRMFYISCNSCSQIELSPSDFLDLVLYIEQLAERGTVCLHYCVPFWRTSE